MSRTALPRSAVMIAFLAAATAAQAQTHESDIPNLASAAFGWQRAAPPVNCCFFSPSISSRHRRRSG